MPHLNITRKNVILTIILLCVAGMVNAGEVRKNFPKGKWVANVRYAQPYTVLLNDAGSTTLRIFERNSDSSNANATANDGVWAVLTEERTFIPEPTRHYYLRINPSKYSAIKSKLTNRSFRNKIVLAAEGSCHDGEVNHPTIFYKRRGQTFVDGCGASSNHPQADYSEADESMLEVKEKLERLMVRVKEYGTNTPF